MKKIVNYIKILIVGLALYIPSSCNYLNVDGYFNDMLSLDTVFARKVYLDKYVWGTAGLLPNEGLHFSGSSGPYMTATDEAFMPWYSDYYGGVQLYMGNITPFSSPYETSWSTYYKGIRKANTIITRIDECRDLNAIDKLDLLGLAYYMRGYFYYQLVMLYGPVPLLPQEPLAVDAPIDELSFERNTYDQCVDYICADMEKAASLLDAERNVTEKDKPTKYAALSVISRLRLHAASPWFQENAFYSNWKDSKGDYMISQEYDEEKWAKSAYASKVIIDSDRYMLHTIRRANDTRPLSHNVSTLDFPNGAGNIDPFRSYSYMFTGESLDARNDVLILGTPYSTTYNLRATLPYKLGGQQGLAATQVLVDGYKDMHGKDVVYGDDDHEEIGTDTIFSEFHMRKEVAKRYQFMEPRFYATIGFCHSWWDGSSSTSGWNQHVSLYYSDGDGAPEQPTWINMTGYSIKKYHFREDSYWGSIGSKTFPIFRYAETLLNYVEAINELDATYSYKDIVTGGDITVKRDIDEMVMYFNQVRYRSGMPGITPSDASDKEKMRALIQRERLVEFAHEGRRYHDVRRWGIADVTESRPVQGMDITKSSLEREDFYKVVTIDFITAKRNNFSPKMYFWPIHNDVLRQNTKLSQNPLW